MGNKKYEEMLGTAPVKSLIIKMAVPSIAAQIVNLLYSIIDRIYIGHIPEIGTDALAGIGVTNTVIILIAAFAQIVGNGGAPLAAMALGRGDRQKAEKILGNGMGLLIFFSVIIIIVVYIFMEPLLRLTGASDNTLVYAVDYLKIYLIGTFFVQVSIGLNTFINTQGRPQIAMLSVIIGALLNIVLDPIFIFVLKMNVAGAAFATLISQFVSAVIIIYFLTSRQATLKIKKSNLRPDGEVLKEMFALGISPFIMASTESLIGFVLNSGLAGFGDIYVSTLTIMQSALQFVSVPLVGFAQGYVPVISYNYGHKNADRVKKSFYFALSVMFVFNAVVVGFMVIFPGIVARMFTSDSSLIDMVEKMMPVFLAGMIIFGLQRACQNTFIALGEAKISLFIALLRKVIFLVPLALILPKFFGVLGIYSAEAIADGTAAILCTVIFMIRFPKILNEIKDNKII